MSRTGKHGSRYTGRPALQPDYERLVQVLMNLRQPPDGLGEVIRLSPAEAAQIRACGFHARANCLWRCPLIPDQLVWWNELSHLSDSIPVFHRGWNPNRAPARHVSPIDPLSKRERQVIRLLQKAPDNRLRRRDLQHRLSRRVPAWFLDHMLNQLLTHDYICLQHGWIYPYSRQEFESLQQKAREPRRPTLLYAV